MLPRTIDADAGDHVAKIDENNGFHMLFVSREALKEKPFRPHWVRECADKRTLHAMGRWFAARRERWQEWGELASAIGMDAFWLQMERTLETEPLEAVLGNTVTRLADPREIGLGEMLEGRNGHRTETLCVHRFASAAHRERFLDWFHTGDNFQTARQLVGVAWSAGTEELGRILDDIARRPSALKAPMRRPRRSGRPRSASTARHTGSLPANTIATPDASPR